MRQVLGGVATLVAVAGGFVLFTSLGSSAQEGTGEPADSVTTTTVAEDDGSFRGRLEFGPSGGLFDAIDEFLACLEERGVVAPEEIDRGFRFDFAPGDESLADLLEECGLPGRPRFEALPDEFGEGFFGFRFEEGFPEDWPFGEPFFDELRRGPFSGDGFPGHRFEFHGPIDRDALAECLAELGSFDSVGAVREQLDLCLPPGSLGSHFDFDLEIEERPPTTTTTVTPAGPPAVP